MHTYIYTAYTERNIDTLTIHTDTYACSLPELGAHIIHTETVA